MKAVSTMFGCAAMIAAQPCFAAQDHREGLGIERRTAAFAGVHARIPFGDATPAAPIARLKLGMVHSRLDRGSATPHEFVQTSGLELGLARRSKPMLFIGGRSVADVQKRLAIGGGTTPLLVVGGIALAAAAVVVLSSDGSSACIPEDPDCD
jgi:hypothetical protein